MPESPSGSYALPGDTTPADWDGTRFIFYAVDDHGKEGIARKPITGKDRSDEVVYVFCEEHKDFEVRRRRITAAEALLWAQRKAGLVDA